MSSTKTWFDLLFDEFHARGEVMFAFSRKQVEEAFQGDLAVTWEQLQSEWASVGAGLLVKRTALKEFIRRMKADEEAWLNRQREVKVKYLHTDSWDRPVYEVVWAERGAPAHVGQTLLDVALLKPGEAVTLHCHTGEPWYEPSHALDIRVVYVEQEPAK